MFHRSCVAGAALTLVGLALLFSACDGKVDHPAGSAQPAPSVASTSDGSASESGASGTCELAGDQCVGDPRCCPPIGGYRVDMQRQCRIAVMTPFYCAPPNGPVPTPNVKRCGCSEERSCFWREVDAGSADASIEVFLNPCYVTVPGFQRCDADLEARTAAAGAALCP